MPARGSVMSDSPPAVAEVDPDAEACSPDEGVSPAAAALPPVTRAPRTPTQRARRERIAATIEQPHPGAEPPAAAASRMSYCPATRLASCATYCARRMKMKE